jgi:nitrite reductase/ring-hydroxylating ferredoxin subunit
LHADTVHVADWEDDDGSVVIETEAGPTIRASAAVFATNSPTNDKVEIHAKQMPMRTYVVAGRVPKRAAPDALIRDTLEAYHYVRIQEASDTENWLIVGGEDHRSGEATDMDARIGALAEWTRRRYPRFGEVEFSWSGQVMETIDFMPFSGVNPGNKRTYVHTGDSGQGITNGVAGALTIAPLIVGQDSRFAEILDPRRKSLTSKDSLIELLDGQVGVMKNFAEYLGPSEISSVDALKPGEGGILREGISRIAVCKDAGGKVHRRSAVCTHLGCLVHWNPFEQSWDCPCHGSQFAPDGQVLNGPAVTPLAEA